MNPVQLILVGGFLGAGKTTLLAQAAGKLVARGKRVGLITNDQAADLVDTAMLRGKGFDVGEVAGGCFCCRFDELVSASDALLEKEKPDVLIGEPVGSCTDLAATVVQPMNAFHGGKIHAAPFTVLTDPERLTSILSNSNGTNPRSKKVCYIYSKQLEEADVIVLNKTDSLSLETKTALVDALTKHFPHAKIMTVSGLTGEGVDAWLDYIQADHGATGAKPGQNIAEVDYDIYAEGEAELGWLNASVTLASDSAMDWKRFCLELLKNLRTKLRAQSIEAAHVKLALNAHGVALVANLTSTNGQPFLLVQGTYEGPTTDARLLFNARVQTDPDTLRALAESTIRDSCGDAVRPVFGELRAFMPGRPVPIHRFTK